MKKNQDILWKSILTSLPVWALVIAHFGHIWGFYTLLFQLPTYFRTVLGLEIKKVSQQFIYFVSFYLYLYFFIFRLL